MANRLDGFSVEDILVIGIYWRNSLIPRQICARDHSLLYMQRGTDRYVIPGPAFSLHPLFP